MYKKLLLLSLLASPAFASISINPQAHAGACTTAAYCTLTGTHDIEIYNDSAQDRIYQIHASLCADNGDCEKYNKPHVIVPAFQKHIDHHEYILNAKFNMAGMHTLTAYALVQNPHENNTNQHSANVTVYRR